MTLCAPTSILALDIGTTCGWAFSKADKITGWGVEDFRVKGDDPHTRGLRFTRFAKWLHEWGGVEEVLIESVGAFQHSQAAIEVYYGMLAVIRMFCSDWRIPLRGMHTSTLKKQFTGNGRADKLEMCALAHRLGWRGGIPGTAQDHDAADACALIVCIQKERGIEIKF